MNDLSGKVALVTGGSRGISTAIDRRLAAQKRGIHVETLTYATATPPTRPRPSRSTSRRVAGARS